MKHADRTVFPSVSYAWSFSYAYASFLSRCVVSLFPGAHGAPDSPRRGSGRLKTIDMSPWEGSDVKPQLLAQ